MLPNTDFFDPGLYIEVLLENESALVLLSVGYSYAEFEADLISNGLSITDFDVYFYNETSNEWELADETVYVESKKLVIGYFNHTTVIGVLGRSESILPFDKEDLPLIILITVILLIVVFGGIRRIFKK